MFIFERERVCAQVGEGQRETETQNPKQAPGSELSAQSSTQGSNPRAARSWAELNWLSHPGTPLMDGFKQWTQFSLDFSAGDGKYRMGWVVRYL